MSAYKYCLTGDLSIWWRAIGLERLTSQVEDISQWGTASQVWLTLSPAGMTVSEFYSWNGAGGRLTKDLVPDFGRRTYRASCLHDCLMQFRGQTGVGGEAFPLSRRDIDAVFYQVMRSDGFVGARLYWLGVRLFGWVV